MEGGSAVRQPLPLPVGFCPLLKKSAGNLYLKSLDFSQLFVVDANGSLKSPIHGGLRKNYHNLVKKRDLPMSPRSTKMYEILIIKMQDKDFPPESWLFYKVSFS